MARFLIPASFCLGVALSACQQFLHDDGQPFKPGTTFQQVVPGSNLYQEIPADRPLIMDLNTHR